MTGVLTRRRFGGLAAAAALATPTLLRAQGLTTLTLPEPLPDGVECDFLALSLADGQRWQLEGSRTDRRVAPYSTFKIPHTLIGLREGAITGLDHMRSRNPDHDRARPGWPESWLEDHDLASAFQNSVIWYFTQISREVPRSAYRRAMRDFDYGNADAGFANNRFWIDGTLQLSLTEQLAFLARLTAGYLDVPEEHLAILDEISVDGQVAGRPLHGKTGLGERFRGGGAGGWYVGWAGARPAPLVFALYCEGPDFDSIRDLRRSTALSLVEQALSE
ncbi:penicillin-binding transpeptidase domain-containing protein [Pontivivens insulae]|uniref:Beta-lactamase n=1 Tax=Pontivivens insulae TaxID=1639689 RepID=A0A2R8ACC4_9RHOB|nr:penicillin-binding transpeptidase domain-containing protein [Pontivivens insulae]RED13812.1 beta-lactamase class D [Pontivivens insulae]SPF29886.1 Beta-lactamase OXA-2 [Pontivivens insulae]